MVVIKNPVLKVVTDYLIITVAIFAMAVGCYFFKFPNNFAFGGVTGFSSVISAVTPISASTFTFWANMILLVIGFLFVGKSFGMRTVYATILFSTCLKLLEKIWPMTTTLTDQPMLELVFAILIPAVASAILFQIGASSGGTDIIAMILKKYTSIDTGMALLLADCLSVGASFFLLGPTTGLYSCLGLLAKSVLVDDVIQNVNLCKCVNVVCSDPGPICDYIMHDLKRGATTYEATGAYSHEKKTIIMSTMRRSQAQKLRAFIHSEEPGAFLLMTNSSEVMGKGFQIL